MRTLLLLLLASSLIGPALAGATPPPSTVMDAAPQSSASGPSAKTPESAFVDRMIGTWNVIYVIYDKDGKVRRLPGQVSYGWILDGTALQEIWSDVDGTQVKPYATTISYLDAKHGRWTAVWMYPAGGMPTIVSGSVVNGQLVLTGHDPDGALQRWTIDGVQADAFVARYESSEDEGKTWRAVGVNYMRRHAAP